VVDIFEEVEGELRVERYKSLGMRILPWVLAGLFAGLLIAGGAWAVISSRERASAEASENFAAALKTAESRDYDTAFAEFEKVSPRARSYKALALSHQGAIRVIQGKNREASALFDKAAQIAPGGDLGQMIADSARLKSALALMDEASFADIETRLKPLLEEGRPYRPLAREALAFAKLKDGKVKEAREDFVVLSLMQAAPQGVRDRSNGAIAMIDSGLAAQTGAVTKAAVALPPPPIERPAGPGGFELTPEMIEQMMQQQGAQGGAPPGAPPPAPPAGAAQ